MILHVVKNQCLKAKADRIERQFFFFFASVFSSQAYKHAWEQILKLSWDFVHAEFQMSQMGRVYDLTKIGPKLSSVAFIFENAVQGELFLAYPILF